MSFFPRTAGGSVAPASSADGRTFTRAAATGTVASVLKNGASVATITAAAGLLSYTFATPQLATDQIAFLAAALDARAGVATALAAGTPVVSGTTFDPANLTAGQALSNSNRTLTSSTSSNPNGLRAVAGFSTGKRYIEFTATNVQTNWQVAIAASGLSMTNGGNGFAGFDTAVTIRWDGAVYKGSSFSNPMNLGALVNGDVIGIALDMTNKVYFVRKNGGTWYGNAGTGKDPTVPAQGDPLPSGITATTYFAAIAGNSGGAVTMNPTPSSVPTGYSTLSSSVGQPAIFIQLSGQSNAQGQAEDAAGATWTDPSGLTFVWDGGKYVDYVPNLRTGVEFESFAAWVGPEIGFLPALRAANPGVPILLCKDTAGGTGLYQSADGTSTYDWSPSSTGELYAQSVTRNQAARAAATAAGYALTIHGVWVQGEFEAAAGGTPATSYQTNLTALINAVRTDWGLGATGVFVIARLRPGYLADTTIRTAQFSVAAANPGGPVSIVETSDLPVNAGGVLQPNGTTSVAGTHYNRAGQTTLGQRIAASIAGTYTEPAN
ncbi:sialate O-acetylesterase [Methylobacterium sp. J-070]|uniref:sialate O-acetylesterase n=1 Tax=Methylobacterium sp. J-070 TaxID=2836650 RepID=UPI001FBB4B86|nr:sialate O-acetylesterase [Methylobacterium sp. J-070]MCJ2053977.1 hypothetical protein [Methylobacterium sp. J-070]